MGAPAGDADSIARRALVGSGKRWRPFLTVCAYRALQDDPDAPLDDTVKKVAIAVECFHKASLVHDDIEDDDDTRYGRETLHVEHGLPIAMNVGDLLIGEGYRLLAESGAPPQTCGELVRIAARGHRELCLGQGAELAWTRSPRPVTVDQILEIFRQKTAPAFQVALGLGAALAGADSETHEVLHRYSDALGIAYQIRDDVEDIGDDAAARGRSRATLPLALALQKAAAAEKAWLFEAWAAGRPPAAGALHAFVRDANVDERARGLLEGYKEAAIRTLPELHNASLKGLLRRVVGKIFRVEIQGWCSEFETRDAAGRAAGADRAR
jgi:geranylgeranyl pyrophosphate synthase